MQTFLAYPEFVQSAQVLDNRRLGKQRVEAWQIYNTLAIGPYTLNGRKTPWYNHPAVQMWKDYDSTLLLYGISICNEWIRRGFKDTLMDKFMFEFNNSQVPLNIPYWMGNDEFHASHRSNLLRKDYNWYSQFGWTESNNLSYVWPTKTLVTK